MEMSGRRPKMLKMTLQLKQKHNKQALPKLGRRSRRRKPWSKRKRTWNWRRLSEKLRLSRLYK